MTMIKIAKFNFVALSLLRFGSLSSDGAT